MADIFISYAREDRERARELATALGARGWSVFWDRQIPPGVSFDVFIEGQVKNARAVVVLWSRASAASDWVKNEAGHGKDRTPPALVPALIEDCEPPFAFRHLQAADLTDWKPAGFSEDFEALVSSLDQIAPRAASVRPPAVPPPRSGNGRRLWALGAVAAVVVGMLLGLPPTPEPEPSPTPVPVEPTPVTPAPVVDAKPEAPPPAKRAFCTQQEIDSQSIVGAFDLGYPGYCPKYVRVDDDEFCDYCRVVGNHGDYRLFCTKGTAQGLTGATLQSGVIDAGFPNECEWTEFGGVPAFKRVVGNNHEQFAITRVLADQIAATTYRPR